MGKDTGTVRRKREGNSVDPTSRRIESYLADRNKEFSVEKLAHVLHLKYHILASAIRNLERQGYVQTRYEGAELFVIHIAWTEREE